MSQEHNRIRFLVARDGNKGAKEFALRTLRQYRKALLANPKLPNRKELIKSYITLKRFYFDEPY